MESEQQQQKNSLSTFVGNMPYNLYRQYKR